VLATLLALYFRTFSKPSALVQGSFSARTHTRFTIGSRGRCWAGLSASGSGHFRINRRALDALMENKGAEAWPDSE
jgi:hypothetical protein